LEKLEYLAHHPEWSLVYFDYDATIFLKNIPQNERWISRYKMDLNQCRSTPLYLVRIGARKVVPYQNINRAQALGHMGFYPQARAEAQEAINVDPRYVKIYEILGAMDLEEKRFVDAYEHLRKVLLLNPSNFVVRHQIATAFYHLDRLPEAEVEIARILSAMPQNAKTKYLLSAVQIKEKKYKEAFETFQEAYTILPILTDEILEVGDTFCAQGQYHDALEVYGAGIKLGKNLAIVYEHRALCYQKQGKDDLAREDMSLSSEVKNRK
jgi:tetratricopeptide (TPR) repeat protein